MEDNRLPLKHCKAHGRHYRTYCYQCRDEDVIGKERRELFQKVALQCIYTYSPYQETDPSDVRTYCDYDAAKDITEAILTASQKFAEQQPRKSEGESE